MTTLRTQQRDVVQVCLGAEPDPGAIARLGQRRIWELYREMVRSRLRKELYNAFKRTVRVLGEERFDRLFDAQLTEAPPRSRPFHGVVGEFARYAAPVLRRDGAAPAYAADLLVYEATRWEVSDLPDQLDASPVEFAFELEPVLAPALRLLHLHHAVHERPRGGDYPARAVYLCVYRPAEAKKARTWAVNAVTFALMQYWAQGGYSVTGAVQRVATERGLNVDDAFLEGLCEVLAGFLERGIVLGSRPGETPTSTEGA